MRSLCEKPAASERRHAAMASLVCPCRRQKANHALHVSADAPSLSSRKLHSAEACTCSLRCAIPTGAVHAINSRCPHCTSAASSSATCEVARNSSSAGTAAPAAAMASTVSRTVCLCTTCASRMARS
eukprot:scaffold34206_cov63-Phaeocystis_antarctica.AAC.2